MTKKQVLKVRKNIYKKLPNHLNFVGFIIALMANFNYTPSIELFKDVELLKVFYKEYDEMRNNND